ncbi:fumarylacetoacetase [Nocardioides fonticola]|uniref:fumarylacetoacetase n=1 Tax=Nocardioides fonticola TaxID=450363 RepID=A0ABP7XNL0_9ACTN
MPGAAGSGFDVDHLPWGLAELPGLGPRPVVRIGEHALDLAGIAEHLPASGRAALAAPTLDTLLALPADELAAQRDAVRELLTDPAHRPLVAPHLHPLAGISLRLPITVADVVDFYASEHHATRVGSIFRPDGPALPQAWKHLPIGYHGRAGSVVVSGTPIRRPAGQRRGAPGSGPTFGPSERLDLEAEVGFVVGRPSVLGRPVPVTALADHVVGVALVNDWSARDLQAWEYVPLGPFLGKSFATSIAAWITPLAALEAAWTDPPAQSPEPLPYLRPAGRGLDLALEVLLDGEVVARPPFASTYWTPSQMLAHLTSNGAAVRTGDLFASGTVSGPGDDERGCLLELTRGGTVPLPDGRTWLTDGTEVTVRASAPSTSGGRLHLGEVSGRIVGSGL